MGVMRAATALRAITVMTLLLAASSQSAFDADGLAVDASAYPVEVTQLLMCQSCYAAVKEFIKAMGPKLAAVKKKLARQVVVFDGMETFCHEANFFDYTGFPPEFRKGCDAFLDRYNEDSVVEDALSRGGTVETQCKAACAEVCDGFSEAQRFSEYVVDSAEAAAAAARAVGRTQSQPEQVVTQAKPRDAPFQEGPASSGRGGDL